MRSIFPNNCYMCLEILYHSTVEKVLMCQRSLQNEQTVWLSEIPEKDEPQRSAKLSQRVTK